MWTERDLSLLRTAAAKLLLPNYCFNLDGMTLALRGWFWVGQVSESFDGFLLGYREISSTSLMYVLDR